MEIKGTPKEIADLVKEPQGQQQLEGASPETMPKSNFPREWRRFEVITNNTDRLREMEEMLDEKGLNRQDIALILFTLRVRPEFGPKDFGI